MEEVRHLRRNLGNVFSINHTLLLMGVFSNVFHTLIHIKILLNIRQPPLTFGFEKNKKNGAKENGKIPVSQQSFLCVAKKVQQKEEDEEKTNVDS